MKAKAHRCQECKAVSYYGRPGLHAEQCIPHERTCSQYPSAGQRQDQERAERDRRNALADATVERLVDLGYQSARTECGRVTLDADDAARLLEECE
jgi:hypothetical protein